LHQRQGHPRVPHESDRARDGGTERSRARCDRILLAVMGPGGSEAWPPDCSTAVHDWKAWVAAAPERLRPVAAATRRGGAPRSDAQRGNERRGEPRSRHAPACSPAAHRPRRGRRNPPRGCCRPRRCPSCSRRARIRMTSSQQADKNVIAITSSAVNARMIDSAPTVRRQAEVLTVCSDRRRARHAIGIGHAPAIVYDSSRHLLSSRCRDRNTVILSLLVF
jgi:hypothetical protein